MAGVERYLQRTSIAYISMEIAIEPGMNTYSGGLGVLAGDVARSAADLGLPMVFVTLVSRGGYLRQTIDASGWQVDEADPWTVESWASPLGAMSSVEIEGRIVWIRPWLRELASPHGVKAPLILLDTDLDQNSAQDRRITDRLYGGDDRDRLKQEIVLGIGADRILNALGFRIRTYHLNEGHAAFLPLSILLRRKRDGVDATLNDFLYDTEAVRRICVFTTHTPVEAGHDQFAYDEVASVLGDFIEMDQLRRLAGDERLNMTRLALNLSGRVNGVARKHAETARHMFPGYHVRAITNGVHVARWTHPAFAELYQRSMPHWSHEPEFLARVDAFTDDEIWSAHKAARQGLLLEVEKRTGRRLDPASMILGFARRITGYKRADLLFSDVSRLERIADAHPFNILVAGKAHPRDDEGKRQIQEIVAHSKALDGRVNLIFLPGYDLALAACLVSGCDVWLNTPLPPLEASGTSGMKAALNGVLNFSVLDGWWLEAWEEGVTGWAVDDLAQTDASQHARLLYEKLGNTILPLFYEDRAKWIWMMKQSISRIGPIFNSTRMMRRYVSEAYLR